MKLKLKIIFKWLLRLVIFLFIIEAVHFIFIAYPDNFFEHRFKYWRYSIYSDASINWEVLKIFDKVEGRIIATEVFDTSFAPKVFICHNSKLYSFFTFLLRMSPSSSGVNVSLVDNTFINTSRIEKMKANHDKRIQHSHIAGETDQIIAHELIHNLTQNRIGWSIYRRLPGWKREGYAEYGSVISNIGLDKNFESLVRRSEFFFEEEFFIIPFHSKEYYKFQLLVEYLFKVEKKPFDIFIKNTNSEKAVFSEFMNWYREVENNLK